MRTASLGRLAIALGLLVVLHGCATPYEVGGIRNLEVNQSSPGNPGMVSRAPDAAPSPKPSAGPRGVEQLSRSEVAKAMAYEGRGSQGNVRQVAGESPMSAVSSSIKQGFDKVTGLFQPPQPKPTSSPSDPTSLASNANPGPELYVAMGRLSEQTGRLDDAERQYQKALAMAPEGLDALVAYARFRDRQGRLGDAIQLYQRAAKAHPDVSSVHNDLGLCHARNRDYRQAIVSLNRAVELEPNRKLYRNNLATVLVESGDNDGALKQLAAVHGEAVACYNLGYLLQKKGQKELAMKLFATALEKDPSLVQAKTWLDQLQNAPSAVPGQPAMATASRPPLPSASAVPSGVPAQSPPDAPLPGGPEGARERQFQARRTERAANPSVRLAPWQLPGEAVPPMSPMAGPAGPPTEAPASPGRGTSSALPAAPLPSDSPVAPVPHPLPPVEGPMDSR